MAMREFCASPVSTMIGGSAVIASGASAPADRGVQPAQHASQVRQDAAAPQPHLQRHRALLLRTRGTRAALRTSTGCEMDKSFNGPRSVRVPRFQERRVAWQRKRHGPSGR